MLRCLIAAFASMAWLGALISAHAADIDPFASPAALEGDWAMRVLDPETSRPARHYSFTISKVNGGRIEGGFPDALHGGFRNGALVSDDSGATLTFRTARGAVGWLLPPGVKGGELFHEARFDGRRISGVSMSANGEVALRWYARRRGDNDDYGAFLAGRTWRLSVFNPPGVVCDETYAYRDDGTMTTRSGAEVIEATWRIDSDDDNHELVTRVTATNGAPDCQGNTRTRIGDERRQPIVFANGGGYAVCGPDRGMSCYANVSEVRAPKPAPSSAATPKPAAGSAERPVDVLPMQMTPEDRRVWRARQCDNGDGAACFALSKLLERGDGGGKDLVGAVAAQRKGCDAGHEDACLRLANALANGVGAEKDEAAAVALAAGVCDKDNALGCFAAGRFRFAATPDDPAPSLAFFRRACDLGHKTACGDAAMLVIRSASGEERPERLRAMLEAGCEEAPLDGSCFFLGTMLVDGQGGPADQAAGYEAFRRGCGVAEKQSCFAMAEMIASGRIDGMTRRDARRYYDFACDKGVDLACKRIRRKPAVAPPAD